MNNVKDDNYYIRKMIDDIVFIINCTDDVNLNEFSDDEILNSAVSFKLIQISENMGHLSSYLIDTHKEIPWGKIKGFRNKLVHDYGHIIYDVMFSTIKNDLPLLLDQLKLIIE